MRQHSFRLIALASLGFFAASASFAKNVSTGTVTYAPQIKYVQGNQPYSYSYPLAITSPANLPANTSVTVTLNLSVLSSPSGVSTATALSFVTLGTSTLTFTGPNQTLTTTVSVVVPLGTYSGDYAWHIQPSGWPSGLTVVDAGATINATFAPPASTDTSPPAIAFSSPANNTVYSYDPTVGTPVSIPVQFEATAGTGGAPITAMTATINGTPVTLNVANLNTLDVTAAGSVSLTTAGTYQVIVTAANQYGVTTATSTVLVVITAPPPAVSITSPASTASYTFTYGGSALSVPFSFTAVSSYNNLTAVSASLNGSPVSVTLSGLPTPSGTATGTLSITAPGSYTLSCGATNIYGTTTQTVTFTVNGVVPPPTVSITAPANNATYSLTAGSTSVQVPFTFQGATSYGTIQSAAVTLNGTATTATVNGLNTASATGSGTLSISAAGTYTLAATVSNSGATASTSTTFTVTQQSAQVTENLTWLAPLATNKSFQGGSTVPIRFTLTDGSGQPVNDKADVISIYEVYTNGTGSAPTIYPYGQSGPNPPDYSLTNGTYQLNFPTANGQHHYVIEVYHPLDNSGSNLQLLGSHDLFTFNQSCNGGNDGDHHWGNGDNGGDHQWGDNDHDGNGGGNCYSNHHGPQGGHQGDHHGDGDDRGDDGD